MGSTLTSFYSSQSGNSFGTLELPGINVDSNNAEVSKFTTLNLNNSSWDSITFWNGVTGANNEITVQKSSINGDDTLNIPSSLQSVTMTGSTCENPESKEFVLNWIDCITQESGESAIGSKTLIMNNINWASAPYMTYEQLGKLAKFNGGHNSSEYGTMQGYIVLSSESQLTAEQLTQIKAWFGDSVFNKNSSGLVIDQMLDYIQVNVGSSATIQNGQVYLKEGFRASLNATRFSLSEDNVEYNWYVQQPGTTGAASQVYKDTSLITGDDGITYIKADQSNQGDYDVEVFCTGGAFRSQPVTIHIQGTQYPTRFDFACESMGDTSAVHRGSVSTAISFWQPGIISEFYLTPVGQYDGTISNVQFEVLKDGSQVFNGNSSTLKTGDTQLQTIDTYLRYRCNASHDYGIVLVAASVGSGDFLQEYTVKATVTFESGRQYTSTCDLMLINDAIVIISNDASILYDVINDKYNAQFGETKGRYYKYDLMALSGTLDLSSAQYNTINSLRTQNNKSVLKYLPNISTLNLSGCTSLTSTNNLIDDTTQN